MSQSEESIVFQTTGSEKVTASLTFDLTEIKEGYYTVYMKSEYGDILNRLKFAQFFITDKYGTLKKVIDQTDLTLNGHWVYIGPVYVDSDGGPVTITVTNAGGDYHSQVVSVGPLKLVSQEMYNVSDEVFSEEQRDLLRGIFRTLDTTNDERLTKAVLQAAGFFDVLVGERKNQAIVELEYYIERYNGNINLNNFLEIVEEEFNEAFSLFSDNKGQIDLDVPNLAQRLVRVSNQRPFFTKLSPETFQQADRNGDGMLGIIEFTNAILSYLPFLREKFE
jgi:Ca2+-binding EF-hand superfamily protein